MSASYTDSDTFCGDLWQDTYLSHYFEQVNRPPGGGCEPRGVLRLGVQLPV